MGQLDEFYMRTPVVRDDGNRDSLSNGRGFGTSSSSSIIRDTPVNAYETGDINKVLETFISSPTDRSDIINPDAIIAGRHYANSEEGQLKLQKDLAALRTFAAQQEAAYLEYYNSPEQQALRDREAGLNPDIQGLSGSEGIQTNQQTSSPLDGIQSDEEIRAQKIQNATNTISAITSIFSAVASVCQIPAIFKGMKLTDSQIGVNNAHSALLSAQANAVNTGASGTLLGNIESFEKLAGSEISSRLADSVSSALKAGQSLDIAGWFSDDNNFSNILDTYAPDSSPQYAASFANLRKRMQQTLGNAYGQGKITAENQGSFSGLVADPRYSSDQLTQIAFLKPYMAAQAKAELARIELQTTLDSWNKKYQDALSVDSAVNAANNKNEYDAEFWENLDAELQTAFQNYQATVESLSLEFNEAINANLLEIYRQNPDNEKGFSAAYLFKSGSNATLQDYFYSNNMSDFSNMIQNQMKILSAQGETAFTAERVKSLAPIMPYLVKDEKFGPFSWRHGALNHEVQSYIRTLQSVADSIK